MSSALALSATGELSGVFTLLREENRAGKAVLVAQDMQVPERVVRANTIKANFLCDNPMHLLGVGEAGKARRAQDAFAACRTLHLELLADCSGVAARALCAFFENWQPQNAADHPALQDKLAELRGGNLVFYIDGVGYAHEDAEIQQAWLAGRPKETDSPTVRCLITGRQEPLEKIHGKIKGVPGAQSAGANLISANAAAFHSYGQQCAAIGAYAVFAHVTALNHLIRNSSYWQRVGDTLVLFWAEHADPLSPQVFSLLSGLGPRDENATLTAIMERLLQGKPVDELDLTAKFYILGIAPNAARLSVRFFLQDSFGALVENIRAHYRRLEIVKPSFDAQTYLFLPALMYETVNPNSRDKAASPLLSGATLRAIFTGSNYPEALYEAVILRVRAERQVSRGKAAIIKAYLLQNRNYQEEELTMALNPQCRDQAYVLGRLFAVLERAQEEANPGINATIKDRYLGSASANPALVFPQLLRLAGHHTAKVESGRYREREIGELLNLLEPASGGAFPAQLTLAEQGLFYLGCYHQVQDRYRKKEDR